MTSFQHFSVRSYFESCLKNSTILILKNLYFYFHESFRHTLNFWNNFDKSWELLLTYMYEQTVPPIIPQMLTEGRRIVSHLPCSQMSYMTIAIEDCNKKRLQ